MEVLFASFLLLTSLILTVFLINASFRTEADGGAKMQALIDAENVMAEIQNLAQRDFRTAIASVDGRVWPATDPELVIESLVQWEVLPVPCTELENQYDSNRILPNLSRKELTESVWKVTVQVKRQGRETSLVQLTSLISDLKPETFTLEIVPLNGTLAAPKGELPFKAIAYDPDRQVIKDLIMTWYVEPLNSFGSIHQVRRDGYECVYKNIYQDYGNRFVSTPGYCRLVVRGEYKGQINYSTTEITNQ